MPKLSSGPKCPNCGQGVRYTPHSRCPFCKIVLKPILHPHKNEVVRWVRGDQFRQGF